MSQDQTCIAAVASHCGIALARRAARRRTGRDASRCARAIRCHEDREATGVPASSASKNAWYTDLPVLNATVSTDRIEVTSAVVSHVGDRRWECAMC